MAKAATEKKQAPEGADAPVDETNTATETSTLKGKIDPEHGAAVERPEPVKAAAPLPTPTDGVKVTSVKKFKGSIRPFNQEFNQKNYTLPVDDDVTLDDLTNPAFWANVAGEMEAGNMLYVTLGGDDPRFVWLYVYETGHLWSKVKILLNTSLADEAQAVLGLRLAEATQDFELIHKGGTNKWCVQRIKDKALLYTGGADKDSAATWLKEYKKSLRR